MSKNKASAGKSGAKKIPKRIAGVKIPKGLRDSGNAAVKLAQSPMARELLSAGLAAAAAAVAANTRARKAAEQSGEDAARGFADVANAATRSAGEIKTALVEAAGVAAQQFFSGKFKAPSRAARPQDDDLAAGASIDDADATPASPIDPLQDSSSSDAPATNGSGTRSGRVRAAKPASAPTTPQ